MGKLLNLQQGIYLGKKEKSFHASLFSYDPITPMDDASFISVKYEIGARSREGLLLNPHLEKDGASGPSLISVLNVFFPPPEL